MTSPGAPGPGDDSLIGSLLPVGVRSSERFADPDDAWLFDDEAAVIATAVPGRRQEFATVRLCAREALAELDLAPGPILPGPDRAPRWPDGVVGSMTHCRGYRAAAVARAAEVTALGIDAEPHERLPDGVLAEIATTVELGRLAELTRLTRLTGSSGLTGLTGSSGLHWDRVLFSCKESVFKAWYPLTRQWLEFGHATVRIDPSDGTFTADLAPARGGGRGAWPARLPGRWRVGADLVLTAVTLPAAQPADGRS